jgi:hypothetical protein
MWACGVSLTTVRTADGRSKRLFARPPHVDSPEVLVPLAAEKFDGESVLFDPVTRDEVRDLLVSLAAWTRRLAATDEAVAS